MKRLLATWLAALMCAACSVKQLDEPLAAPGVVNSCTQNSDCVGAATCRLGACFASMSAIDEVVVEVVPGADSPSGGLAYVVMLEGVARGGTRDIALPSLAPFVMQVQLSPQAAQECSASNTTLPARVEFTRIASVGGAPIIGLPAMPVVAVTAKNGGSWNYPLSLVPGSYDIYIQPTATDGCAMPPRLLRGQQIDETVDPKTVPATLELPKATTLSGVVQRRGGTLVGWKVDVIDAQDGRLVSNAATLGATNNTAAQATNFMLQYQPIGTPKANTIAADATLPTGTSLLLRVTPPEGVVAPTVFWDLAVADLNGNGQLSLDMSGLPTPSELVHVEGVVQGVGDSRGIPATLSFASTSLPGAKALTTTFNRTVTADTLGNYSVDLFAGSYRVVASPFEPALASPPPSGSGGRAASTMLSSNGWAVTESRVVIDGSTPPGPIVLSPKRVVRGVGLAGPDDDLAQGATFDANPTLIAADVGVLRGALAQSAVLPQGASVSLDDTASFAVPLDPGTFDLWLRPKSGSNFAWWVAPGVAIASPTAGEVLTLSPRLPLPVAIEGVITPALSPTQQGANAQGAVGLANASVQAYARAPKGSAVTKVAETRTDADGHYRLSLPATFGNL